MDIRQGKYYLAEINYHREDDLRAGSLPNKSLVHAYPQWIEEDTERYAGDWLFSIAEDVHWLPQRDLVLIREVSLEDYQNAL